MENKNADTQPLKLSIWVIALGVLLLIFLPGAGKMRSPGGVSSEWFFCAFGAVGLLLLNLCGLKALWHKRWVSRLGIYLSLAIVALIAGMLVDFAQEQNQFNHRAHHGIRYFDR